MALDQWTRAVGRQLKQGWRALQVLLPVILLCLQA